MEKEYIGIPKEDVKIIFYMNIFGLSLIVILICSILSPHLSGWISPILILSVLILSMMKSSIPIRKDTIKIKEEKISIKTGGNPSDEYNLYNDTIDIEKEELRTPYYDVIKIKGGIIEPAHRELYTKSSDQIMKDIVVLNL